MSIQNINNYIKDCCKWIADEPAPVNAFKRLAIKKTVIGSEVKEEPIP
jgi:hypothetical protein